MSVAFIYNDIYRYSNFGNYHPVLPKRISNVYDFTQLLNIRNNLNFFFNDVADFNTLELFLEANTCIFASGLWSFIDFITGKVRIISPILSVLEIQIFINFRLM